MTSYPLVTNFVRVKLYNWEYFSPEEIDEMVAHSQTLIPDYKTQVVGELATIKDDLSFSWRALLRDQAELKFDDESGAEKFALGVFERHF